MGNLKEPEKPFCFIFRGLLTILQTSQHQVIQSGAPLLEPENLWGSRPEKLHLMGPITVSSESNPRLALRVWWVCVLVE